MIGGVLFVWFKFGGRKKQENFDSRQCFFFQPEDRQAARTANSKVTLLYQSLIIISQRTLHFLEPTTPQPGREGSMGQRPGSWGCMDQVQPQKYFSLKIFILKKLVLFCVGGHYLPHFDAFDSDALPHDVWGPDGTWVGNR